MQKLVIQSEGPSGPHQLVVYVWGEASALPPVVCVHGLTRNGRDFDKLANDLAQTGRLVFCPDMPGRGLSDPLANPADYGFAQYVQDALAIIRAIPARTVDWVGTSMGGIMGLLLAAMPQSPIRRLVLNDVGPYVPQAEVEKIAGYMRLPMPSYESFEAAEADLRKKHIGFGILSDEDWQHMARHSFKKQDDGTWIPTYDPALALPFFQESHGVDLWDIYDAVRCPTLLIRGALSGLLPSEIAKKMTERGPCAKLATIAGAGHAPALMDHYQITLVRDFLTGS